MSSTRSVEGLGTAAALEKFIPGRAGRITPKKNPSPLEKVVFLEKTELKDGKRVKKKRKYQLGANPCGVCANLREIYEIEKECAVVEDKPVPTVWELANDEAIMGRKLRTKPFAAKGAAC